MASGARTASDPGREIGGRSGLIRACHRCGQKNRVPARRLVERARCGRCKEALPPPDHPLDADPELFDEIAASASAPLLVDFWAEWCGPCRMAEPEVERVAARMAGRALVLKVNTELYPALAERFGIRAIPTFVVLRQGQPVFRQSGLARASDMEGWLEETLRRSVP